MAETSAGVKSGKILGSTESQAKGRRRVGETIVVSERYCQKLLSFRFWSSFYTYISMIKVYRGCQEDSPDIYIYIGMEGRQGTGGNDFFLNTGGNSTEFWMNSK